MRIEERAKKAVREAMLGDLAAALKKRQGKGIWLSLKDRQIEAEKAGGPRNPWPSPWKWSW